MGFGRYNPFPRRFGGGKRAIETAHQSLLDRYSKVFTTDDDQLPALEAYAEATTIAAGDAAARRVGNQLQPAKMLENLPVWEEATGTAPSPRDAPRDRRNAVSAKLRGLGPNAQSDIYDAIAAAAGASFVDIHYVGSDDEITYWPGGNPGPPGMDWATNKAIAFIELRRGVLPQDRFDVMVGRVLRAAFDIIPAWMSADWFVSDGDGFTLDVSLLDETGL